MEPHSTIQISGFELFSSVVTVSALDGMCAESESVANDPSEESLSGDLRIVSCVFKNTRPVRLFQLEKPVATECLAIHVVHVEREWHNKMRKERGKFIKRSPSPVPFMCT